jgi:hypothetical protein
MLLSSISFQEVRRIVHPGLHDALCFLHGTHMPAAEQIRQTSGKSFYFNTVIFLLQCNYRNINIFYRHHDNVTDGDARELFVTCRGFFAVRKRPEMTG